jgi:enoyl-CoA hydratase
MSEDFVKVEVRGPLALVGLNRPDKLNALSPEVLSALADTFETLSVNEEVRVIVLHGDQRAFAAGADIQAMAKASPVDILEGGTRDYWLRIWAIDKPVIAAVAGYAFGGGCELAMGCDLILAAESARFAQPEIKLGIMPGAGGTQRLARAVGLHRAMEMILTGEPISAREAFAAGLVNQVVPNERLLDAAIELAETIAARPPVAVRLARQALHFGFERTMQEGLELERRNYRMLYDTQDQKEGMAAFLEKRTPDFKGK